MNIRPIRTEADYEAALAEIDRLIDAPDDSLRMQSKCLVACRLYNNKRDQTRQTGKVASKQFKFHTR